MSNKIKAILSLCEESGIQIISYGLAPNPFGFCFERGDETTKAQCKEMSRLLDSLSETDEAKLRKIIFGGSHE